MEGRCDGSWMLVPRPSVREVSLAISKWSPVIILTSTPYDMALWIVSLVSGRGGSKKVRRPSRCQGPSCPNPKATASARTPRSPKARMQPSKASLEASSSVRAINTWGAPLVTRKMLGVALALAAADLAAAGPPGYNFGSINMAFCPKNGRGNDSSAPVSGCLPPTHRTMPVVRLIAGSKGWYSISSKPCIRSRSTDPNTKVSNASRAGSVHLVAMVAVTSICF
mmetsp:Transcript_28400/g.52283  ORF Transcript_28400/g.52283 Transcript_28400/m.52283 type:complete len:224 (+) Transcript_28400:2024-2695(+)